MSEVWSPDPIAWLNHEWNGGGTLYAYPGELKRLWPVGQPVIHPQLGQKAEFAKRTPFHTGWIAPDWPMDVRDPGYPTTILMWSCFGPDPYEPPENMMEHSAQLEQRDEGSLRLIWKRDESDYRLHRFEFKLRKSGHPRTFDATYRDDDIKRLDLDVSSLGRTDWGATIAFRVAGQIRHCLNYGDTPSGDLIRFNVMGSAVGQMPGELY